MDKTQLTLKQFEDLVSQGYQTIPVYKRILEAAIINKINKSRDPVKIIKNLIKELKGIK